MQWLLLYTFATVFYWKNNYTKVLNGDVYGTSTEPVAGRPGDQMMDILGTPPGRWSYMFLNSTQKHI